MMLHLFFSSFSLATQLGFSQQPVTRGPESWASCYAMEWKLFQYFAVIQLHF